MQSVLLDVIYLCVMPTRRLWTGVRSVAVETFFSAELLHGGAEGGVQVRFCRGVNVFSDFVLLASVSMVERRASGVVLPVATPGMATSNVLQRRVPRLQEQKKKHETAK